MRVTLTRNSFVVLAGCGIVRSTGFQPRQGGDMACVRGPLGAHKSPISITWLSLDAADDDPGRFLTCLIAALQKVDANLGQEIENILHSGQLPPTEVISATLINDILRAQRVEDRFLLVLDDFHVIQDQSILQVLERLVANPLCTTGGYSR